MRITTLILFFLSIFCFAQNTALKIKIDSIISNDSIPNKRKFTINYHIQNLTDNPISFILNPKSISPNATSSSAYCPAYRLYQEDKTINTEDVLTSRTTTESNESFIKNILDEISKLKTDPSIEIEKLTTQINSSIIENIVKLNPKEVKKYCIILYWNKERYTKYFDNEYYLDEKATHYFDLFINLMKEEFKEQLFPEEYKKIMEDKTIIKGWAQSNKMEINFK